MQWSKGRKYEINMATLQVGYVLSFNLNYHVNVYHCIKSGRIRSLPRPYFPEFRLNTKIFSVHFLIQSKCGSIETRKSQNMGTFHTVYNIHRTKSYQSEAISIEYFKSISLEGNILVFREHKIKKQKCRV